jgi:hypothetical protein
MVHDFQSLAHKAADEEDIVIEEVFEEEGINVGDLIEEDFALPTDPDNFQIPVDKKPTLTEKVKQFFCHEPRYYW